MATGYQLNWKKQFPDVKIDSSDEPISKAISKCRLFIYTYNSTGWIEGLMGNVPTILFWRPHRWYLRDEAEFSFDEMKRVGIFHESAESAADHVLRVWDDVAGWWESDEVQSVRVSTCETFGRKSTKPIQRIYDLLKSVCEKH
jgi:putative transferase (TIGR04331 family)